MADVNKTNDINKKLIIPNVYNYVFITIPIIFQKTFRCLSDRLLFKPERKTLKKVSIKAKKY